MPKASHEREARSVETISSDLQEFDRDVLKLADRVAADLTSLPSELALLQMAERLGEARRADETRKRLLAAATKRAAMRSALLAKLETSEKALENACQLLKSADLAEFARNIERLQQRHVLESERAELRRLLVDISDGFDEATLRSEREGVDFDRLPADIERETLSQKQLLEDIRVASVFHDQKRREVEELTKGRDAAGAAARRAEAGAELISIAEQWLVRSATALLARRAIELHRSKVQDPMIARASELFALGTDHAFLGLGIDYDDRDQPVLVARRNAEERVHISGMSEGTRDQLFLALRLALLERRTSEPMPFIGDDLLTSFDDSRTEAGLRLLAAAGHSRQVILFTHHAFVAELAKSIGTQSVQVIQI